MCGIAGIIGPDPGRPDILSAMLSEIAHRGPDGDGLWRAPDDGVHVALGHRRLSILDLSQAGAQPMLDLGQNLVLTFNGEIYNYIELRSELRALGSTFFSDSDSEVILEAYRHWGEACVERFNGMFAFAIFDRARQTLFCARDRFGEKPFVFHAGPDRFVFASEYKALLLHPGVPLEVDEWRLLRGAHNASTGIDADRDTVFRGVQQLLPGEAMLLDTRTLVLKTWHYWRIQPGEREIRETEEAEVFAEFRELLVDSVRLRMRSDVPVGSCLSGGLDSSAIVCIVRKVLGHTGTYDTFTGRFPGTRADEWAHAKQVVEDADTTSHVVEPGVERFMDDLPRFVWANELPVGSSSQFAQWCVFDLARDAGVTVLLDGQGADEVLGGYEQYFGDYVRALRERGDMARLERELPLLRERYPLALVPPARAWRDRLPFGVRHAIAGAMGTGSSLLYGLSLPAARAVSEQNAMRQQEGFNALTNALAQDSFGRYLTTLLRYGDRNSMAHSREVRLPFCDHRIAEFAFSLPPHLLMGQVQTKRLLRESMVGILPEPIRTRWNKQGFRPPQSTWFNAPRFAALCRDTLQSRRFREDGHWRHAWWLRALDRAERGDESVQWSLWAPLMIEWWREHFLAPLERRRASQARP